MAGEREERETDGGSVVVEIELERGLDELAGSWRESGREIAEIGRAHV